MQIAYVTTNEQGEYEYATEEDYTGQTLDFSITKDNYVKKNISYELDKPTINLDDILLDEIKIKIEGKICDATNNPLDNASIIFSIGNSTINLNSDKNGSFSFTVGQQFLNQTIGYEANKEGFEPESGKLKLIEDLRCINLSPSTSTSPSPPRPPIPVWIKVAAIGILLVVAIAIILLPDKSELLTDPDPLEFEFAGTGLQTFSIWNGGEGTLEWYVYSDRDWITIYPDSGTESGKVTVSVNSAFMYPGMHAGIFTVESNGGTKTGMIFLNIPEDGEPPSGAPEIHNFMADPEYIDGPEGEITLSWEISGATSVFIDGIGPVEVSKGSIERWVSETTTFTIRAMNDAGEVDRAITVYVEKP
jgi:hypothetical protein